MDEKSQQELMNKLGMFQQQMQYLQQQFEAIERAVNEMNSLNYGLEDLRGKKDSEIFANIGKGIYARAKLVSEDLLVDIGERNLVKKDIDSTKKIIEMQIKKLEEIKQELNNNIENLNTEAQKMIQEYEAN